MFCTSSVRTMVRRKVTLKLDAEVVQNAKDVNMNLSSTQKKNFLFLLLIEFEK